MKVYILDSVKRHIMGLTVSQFKRWVDRELTLTGFDLTKPIRTTINSDSHKVKMEQED